MTDGTTARQAGGLGVLDALTRPGASGRLRLKRRGAHAKPTAISRHVARFSSFSVIGLFVLVAGILLQWATVRVAGTTGSYVIQAIFSIELSYALNRWVTWRDRDVSGVSLAKWNLQRILMTVPNYLGYAGAIHYLHADWLEANLGVTAVFIAINYTLGDRWSFASVVLDTAQPAVGTPLEADWMPWVSAVIPCRNNPSTIGQTVEALLGQGYSRLAEVIVVGDFGDPTWAGLAHITDPRLIIVEYESVPGRRDPNAKRNEGIVKSSGDVIALVDSDIVMDPDWLSAGVAMLRSQGSGLVAGGMRSIHDTFWGRFVDGNLLAAKTPRLPRPYQVTAANFGKRGYKPPISANALFFRELYDKTKLDSSWYYGYEDYEWFWRVVKDGHIVTFDGTLNAAHHHRRSYRKLWQEYRRSSEGCAWFVRRHPDCPLAGKRRAQAILLPPAALGALAAASYAMAAGYAAYTGTAVAMAIAALCGREVARTRKLEALAYPFIGLSLAVAFTISLAAGLVKPRVPEATVRQTWEDDTLRLPRSRRAPSLGVRWLRVPWQAWALVGVVALAAAVRMWHLAAAPERQLDEITYNSVAINLIRHGTLNVPLAYRQPWQPFLYHPPFYNVLLSLWDRLLSPTIYSARLLGIAGDVVALLLLSRLLWRLYGKQAALFAVSIVAFDGWLIYVQRISYIENLLLPIVIAALLAYERAVRRGTWPSYLLTGLLLGAVSVFNNDGAYLLLVVVVHWALIRRDTLRHAVALGVALAICGLYALAMISAYTLGGTDWWWHDTLVQIRRITGFQASAGTLNSPAALVHLLGSQYGIFLPSVLVGGAAVILLAVLAVRSMRRRSVEPLGPDLIVPSWAIAALLIFGPATLHFPQYFVLVLMPLYCFLWTRTWPWVSKRARPALASLVAVLVLAGLGSSYLRVSQDTSAFAEFQAYAARSIPRHSLIVAGVGDPLGYVIKQQWCSPGTRLSGYCARHASYVVTWQTYLQPPNPLHLASLQRLLDDSRPVKVFRQFSGKLTVWKVK